MRREREGRYIKPFTPSQSYVLRLPFYPWISSCPGCVSFVYASFLVLTPLSNSLPHPSLLLSFPLHSLFFPLPSSFLPPSSFHVPGTKVNPLAGSILLTLSTVIFMKLVSYAHTNNDLRARWARAAAAKKTTETSTEKTAGVVAAETTTGGGGGGVGVYPNNVGVGDMYLFLLFPTLVYQTTYPRTKVGRREGGRKEEERSSIDIDIDIDILVSR